MCYTKTMSIIGRRIQRSVRSTSNSITFTTTPGRAIPATLRGITTEFITDMPSLSAAVDKHTATPTVRVVFQNDTAASYYQSAVATLRQYGYIMGEISDSTALAAQTLSQYRARVTSYVSTFTNTIDIYEIGNELNGEWVGSGPAEINAKVQAAYDVVKKDFASYNLRTAITLNYWPNHDYYMYDWENTLTYAQSIPQEIRYGIDYLLLSFYEEAGDPQVRPTDQDFITIFSSLMPLFPNAKIGMGEIGTANAIEKTRVANRYYGMHVALKSALGPRYTGGYFWWYYYQDCVPWNKSGSLWNLIDSNLSAISG